jgi:ferredoxin, 2Fe-2S
MPIVKFIDLEGVEHQVEAKAGESVMKAATENMIPGIVADCGGSCVCATCHAYLDEAWIDHVPPPESLEIDMLTCVNDRRPNSRLTCQIKLSDQMNGIVVQVAQNEI